MTLTLKERQILPPYFINCHHINSNIRSNDQTFNSQRYQIVSSYSPLKLHFALELSYKPSHLDNGETLLQALARCKHTFLAPRSKWTSDQKLRAEIIFDRYNGLRETHELINDFRTLYNRIMTPDEARKRLLEWCRQALTLSKKQFATVVSTIKNNLFTIASYFRNRATNASAESFNAQVKLFRTQLRGVADTSFFIFRLTKLFA
ncbi:transposase [uncultured Porphyromonas sp.]|uniref:transposase n=1 Tax=uncultured Porphyromonas sp. TaxID=159274 RepID=UPI00338DE26A